MHTRHREASICGSTKDRGTTGFWGGFLEEVAPEGVSRGQCFHSPLGDHETLEGRAFFVPLEEMHFKYLPGVHPVLGTL